jgi:PAS domain-containing protein
LAYIWLCDLSSDLPAPIRLEMIAARIVADAPDAILYTDREGIIRLWNSGCERMFG